ncbi:MAG TPA: hypothetical protein VEV84_08310 [Pyrinomonadaceae bacterium]|nr:hypothetical protein [Pyrinomonadaceae bacterium]
MVNQRDLEFKDILANAVYTIQSRLREYNDKKDPLERNRLKLLYDLVSIEMEKVDSGMADSYSGLRGPLKAAMDWGEPGDSSLIRALQEVELFYRQNYQIDGARTMRMPRRQPISPMIHT